MTQKMINTVEEYLEALKIAQEHKCEVRLDGVPDSPCPEIDECRAWNKTLIDKYPFLAVNDWHFNRLENDYEYTLLDDMPKGWYIAFGLEMCEKIAQALDRSNINRSDYHILQVKEKFGGLRIYDNNSTKEIQSILDKYEELSYHTCCICGAPAKYISKGWICPYCEECATNICLDRDKRFPNSAPHKLEDAFTQFKSPISTLSSDIFL